MKKTKYTASILLAVFLLGACHREELNPAPQTVVTNPVAFSTVARIQNQVLSLYGTLKSGNFYGGRYQIAGDVKADNFIDQSGGNLITDADVWRANPTNSATAVVNLWAQAYLCINNCNVFIAGMNQVGTNVVGAAAGANYIAEAKFVRALSYYSLLQFYAQPYTLNNGAGKGLPLRLSGISQPGFSNLARSPVDSVYAQIIQDLNDAEAALPANYGTGSTAAYSNTTRAHINTAIALKTRVYLTMGQYANVIAEANKIVSAGAPFTAATGVPFALSPDITKCFAPPYTTSENIMSLPMSTTGGDNPGTQNQLGFYFSPQKGVVANVAGGGLFSLNPTGVIADPNWLPSDKRWSFIVTDAGGLKWLNKYPAPSPYTDYPAVIRYSEVLLNLAEALARTNGLDDRAIALLNAVRHRSDPSTTYMTGSFATADDLIAAILEERNIEFLGEGQRNNDLVRLGMTIPGKGNAATVQPTDGAYIWPISSNELSLNTLCTDN